MGASQAALIAFAAGASSWLDLASDRACHAGVASAGVQTDVSIDYLGWAQLVAAASRQLGANTILVDEGSRPERWIEVAAVAELLDAAQLTHVVKLAPDKDVIHASRITGRQLQTVRVRGTAVLGVRIAGAPISLAEPVIPWGPSAPCDFLMRNRPWPFSD